MHKQHPSIANMSMENDATWSLYTLLTVVGIFLVVMLNLGCFRMMLVNWCYVDAQTLCNPEGEGSVEDTLVAEQLAAEKKKDE